MRPVEIDLNATPLKTVRWLCLSIPLLFSCGEKSTKDKQEAKAAAPQTAPGTPSDLKEPISNKPAVEPEVDPNTIKAIVKGLKLTFDTQPIKRVADLPDLSAKPATIRRELMDAFCIHAYKLPLQSDFNTELGVLCGSDKKPTALFTTIDRYAKVSPDNSIALEIANSVDGDYSRSTVISVATTDLPTKFVKEAHVNDYLTAPFNFSYFSQESNVSKDLNHQIGGDLGFSRYELYYSTKNKTDDGKTFRNERTSIYNGYQVQGGSPDIGLITEHLTSTTKDYRSFKTISVSISTQSGGSMIITIANLEVLHNGYPKDARRLAVDTASAQSQHVREGVIREKATRVPGQ